MDLNYTHISVVLDRSGSMANIADDIIGGVNRFLIEQIGLPGKLTVSMARFDDTYEVICRMAEGAKVEPLTRLNFVPRGNTALRDAVGRTIVSLGEDLSALPEAQRPSRIIFVIVSDGKENASEEYDEERIAEMKAHQETIYGWQFIYMGCKQDAVKEAKKSLGIHAQSALTYQASAEGIAEAFASLDTNARQYRAGLSKSMAWTDEDRQRQRGR